MTNNYDKVELAKLLAEKELRQRYNKIDTLFPDKGPYRRELYPKHIEYLNKGSKHKQRAAICGNRIGKTTMACCEGVYHASGVYPDWWEGKVFHEPISIWAATVTNATTRDILQKEYLGSPRDFGSGLIPKNLIIGNPVRKPGVVDAIETVYVRHVSGGLSDISFKSYEQGRDTFQGTKKGYINLDEECPKDIYTECMTRLAGGGGHDDEGNIVDGIISVTFTPVSGLTDLAKDFVPHGRFPKGGTSPDDPYKFVIQIEWDDVPHMTEDMKEELLSAYSPHEREARSLGIPSLGSGAIYPVLEHRIVVEPFQIPVWWPKAFGMDFGWANLTAIVWGAQDPATGVIYIYSEHGVEKQLPAIHASAIKGRGAWITGACDPAGSAHQGAMGNSYVGEYDKLGIDLFPSPGGPGSKDVRISKVLDRYESGMLKIFNTCTQTLEEQRTYHRNEKGDIVKKHDHFMDAKQYLICEFDNISQLAPDPDGGSDSMDYGQSNRNSVTGY